MKQTKFLFLLSNLLLIQVFTTDAFISFPWFTSHKEEQTLSETLKEIADKVRSEHEGYLKSKEYKEYNKVREINDEYENMKKIRHSILKQEKEHRNNVPTSEQDGSFLKALQDDRNRLNEVFFDAQQKWQLATLIYQLYQFEDVGKNSVNPALKKAQKEANIQELPKSWSEQLKEKEAKLSAQERQKSSAERQKEFKEWQANTNFESVKSTREFFNSLINYWKAQDQIKQLDVKDTKLPLRARSLSCPELLENSLSPNHDNTIVVTNIFHPRAISCYSLKPAWD
ncbi:MAG: hypothetical protein AMXMBFR12_03590 [Candidatus Babeliales bacterium]